MLDVSFRTRAVKLAYDYWLQISPQGALPGRRHIDPAEMIAFLPSVLLADVQREPMDFRYRLVGTAVGPLMSRDYTNEWMSEIEALKPPGRVWSNCCSAVEKGKPVYGCTLYTGPKRDIMDVEDLILPLAADGVTVDMLMIILAGTRKE